MPVLQRNSRRVPAALLAAVTLAAVGCRRPLVPDQPAPDPAVRTVRVSPSKLFTGDLKRLEPHLGLMTTGCVRLDAPRPDLFIGFEPEVWQDGKPGRPLGTSQMRVRGPTEASFSVREVTGTDGRPKYQLVAAVSGEDGSGSCTTEVDPPTVIGVTARGTADLSKPRELAEGEAVAVWAFVVHKDGMSFKGRPIEEAPQAARWALVVKLRWERAEGR